jgi:succinoglycan biosynthesis transport protein ExoP
VGALVAGLTTYVITKGIQPVYQASASVLVVNQGPIAFPGVPGTNQGSLTDIVVSDRLMKTYAELVSRPAILGVVSEQLDGAYSAEVLASKVSVSNQPLDTQILRISVKDNDPALAATIANLTAEEFIRATEELFGRPGTLSISQPAAIPDTPVEPRVNLYTFIAAFLGFVIAAVYARGLEYLDDTIKTPDDITTILDMPTLGVIGRAGGGSLEKALSRVSGRGDLSPFLEDVRELRTRVHFLNMDSDVRTLAVVSQNPDEGKTTTAASLAEVLAEAGDQVILVDANLRRPRLHEIYGVANTFGLTGFLMQQDIDDLPLEPTRVKNLRLLPSGPVPMSPSELLTSKRMMQVIRNLKESEGFVIFDTAPLASASDALILASKVDGTLAVVQAGRLRSQEVSRSIDRLRESRANVLGIVLNRAKSSGRQYSYGQSATVTGRSAEAEPPSTATPRRSRRRARSTALREEAAYPPSDNA